MATSKKKKKVIIFSAGGLLLIVLAALIVMGSKKEPVFTVQTEKVQRRTITQAVTATGKIYPEVQVIITPEVSGEIIALRGLGIRVSLFVDPDPAAIRWAARLGADRVELYMEVDLPTPLNVIGLHLIA